MKQKMKLLACLATVCALNAYHAWRREAKDALIEAYEQERAEFVKRDQERAAYTTAVESYLSEINAAINTQAEEQGILNRIRLNIDDTIGEPAPDLCLEIGEGLRRQRAYLRIDEQTVEDYLQQKR